MDSFRLADGSHSAAMEYIVGHLTDAQRLALATAKVKADRDARTVLVYANENTIKSLMGGPGPLVEEDGKLRKLTSLGMDVARYLLATGDWEVPATLLTVPSFLTPINA